MSAGSEARLQALDEVLDRATAGARTANQGLLKNIVAAVQGAPSEGDLNALPGDLFAVVDALDSSVTLRRALTDPGTAEQGRQQLAHTLLDGKVSKVAVQVVAEAVGMRWAGGRVLAAALERQAVRAQLMVAERQGHPQENGGEAFRVAPGGGATPPGRGALR